MIIWKQIGTYDGKKQIIRSVCMFLKDGKIWREVDKTRDANEGETLDDT